jgi:hypothetical protein
MSKNDLQLDIADDRRQRRAWWSHVKLPGKRSTYAKSDPHEVARDLQKARGEEQHLGQN